MDILIVEDRKDKRHNIKNIIQKMGNINIDVAKTYFSARNKILCKKKYNLIIMDMFLPDAKDDSERKGLAGKDLIFDIMREGVNIPVLIVTQYTEYTNNDVDSERKNPNLPKTLVNLDYRKELKDDNKGSYDCTYYEGLHEYLVAEVPMYLGIVFYSNQFKEWENSIRDFVIKVQEDL